VVVGLTSVAIRTWHVRVALELLSAMCAGACCLGPIVARQFRRR
jgi:hypothetical protein